MKFGIFYELQLPRPWTATSEYQLHQDALSQLELADGLGFDYAWEVEHHFLEEYSHSSAPEVFLGAASQRTKNIRLAHGIIQLTTNHPARVAERVSTLDLLCKGRVEFGMGEGNTWTELEPFDVSFEEKRERWKMPSAPSHRCSVMTQRNTTARTSSFRSETFCRNRCRNRTRRCGSPARNCRRSRWRGAVASVPRFPVSLS